MGRRGVPVGDASRWVFNRLAEAYRHRPGYPVGLVDRLASLAGGGRVADLGAGTGHLALPLAERGLEVHAVEPARAMLDVLCERAAALGLRVMPVHAAAEETPLPQGAFDLVVLADALHWVDPELAGQEIARILKPRGALALVEASPSPTPFMREVESIFARFNPRARRSVPEGAREQVLRLPGAAEGAQLEVFEQELSLDSEALEGVVRSLSFAGPALGEERMGSLLAEVRGAAERFGGATWARTLRLTWGTRRDAPELRG
jgi:ubiquinone/menaquinone biosynthesis C-methylase UbiE